MITNNVALIPIQKEDEEIYRTISFINKFKEKRIEIRNNLVKKISDDGYHKESIMALGILNFIHSDEEDVISQKDYIYISLESFSKVQEKEPENWLARIYKLWLMISILPVNFTDKAEVEKEVEELIYLQENNKEKWPCFVVGYFLSANFYYNIGEYDKFEYYLSLIDKLEAAPIKYLKDFLVLIFVELEKKLNVSNEVKFYNRVHEIRMRFFPDYKDA